MKKYILSILLLLLPSLCFGWGVTSTLSGSAPAGTPGSSCSYVHCNGFELQADDDDWTTASGTPDYDSTSFSPDGLESMKLDPSESASIAVTARAETWISLYIRFNDNNSATESVVLLYNNATLLATLSVEHDQKWKVQAEGGTLSAGETFAANTGTPYFKLRFKQGTGANAEIEFWASTDGTNWANNQSSTDGTSTEQVNKVLVQNAFGTKVLYIDSFKENSANITDAT